MEVINEGKVLLKFSAAWCGHCVAMEPVIEKIEEEYKGTIRIQKIDIDSDMDTARQYKITSIPAFVLLEDGNMVKKKVGAMTLAEMKEFLG